MILIVGGTGALGGIVARELLAAGEPVRVMTRSPARAQALRDAGADVVRGDLLDPPSLAEACAGVRSVVAAAHSILGRGRSASVHVDGEGHRRLVDTAKASGARQVVHISVQVPHPSYAAVPFFRIKQEVERHVAASGLRYTILRPTAFMEVHAHQLIGAPILRGKPVVMFGRGDRPRNFVAAGDVARLVLLALRDESLAGQTLEIGGPENLTGMDVVRIYERASGRTARVRHVPLGVARAVSVLARPLHPGLSQVLRSAVLAETTDQRFDARPLPARAPAPLTRLEDWVARRVSEEAAPTPRVS